MKKNIQFFLAVVFLFASLISNAQRHCAAHENLQQMMLENPEIAKNREAIERHTQAYVSNPQAKDRAVITIPVVFHIVWRTGKTAENISDAQVMSQLDVINKDFRKLNSDVTKTPSLFSGLAADAEIQFCLAQRTPSGTSSTGIVRYQSTRTTDWGTSDAVKKPASGGYAPWDATKYLNIWVCSIGGSILGYAQFPGGSTATDGVVIDYRYFGTTGTASAPFNLGRTATHEIGHWLNLSHIWGDANCGNDFVGDTPTHTTSNAGCPAFPKTNTCGGTSNTEMTMNYMDYTDDACMYMFSAGQKARMQALFATGGSRASMLTSLGCQAGTGTTCAVPASLASSLVTTTGATVSWGAATGAVTYNLQYKPSTSTTWTTVSVTGTSRALTGLTANTTYNYQVATVCSGSTSAYSTAATFTTSAATTTCAVPTGLASASITSSGATVSWGAATGAVTYNLQYKTAAATTWTTVSVTGTSRALTGLTAATAYNYQVATVCSGSTSAYSTAATFTTTAAACTDIYEANESRTAAKSISIGTTIKALIGTSTDQDWFKIVTTTAAPKLRVTLSALPADYDLYLYNSSGTLLTSSQKTGTTTESFNYNSATKGATYYIRVVGFSSAFNATTCYSLLAESRATNFRTADGNDDEATVEVSNLDFIVAPNPANDAVVLNFLSKNSPRIDVTIQDLTGRVIQRSELLSTDESNKMLLDVSQFENGLYIINVKTKDSQKAVKLMIQH